MVWFQINEQQKDAVLELERSGSDRVIAIVGTALLDQSLRVALEWRLKQDDGALRMLFDENSPLSGAPKVTLGYLLHMYEKDARHAMMAMYTVRNYFAHNLDMSFDTKKYSKAVAAIEKLKLHENRTMYPDPFVEGDSDHPIGPIESNKDKFLANLKIALIWLAKDFGTHLPYQNTPSGVTFSREKKTSAS